jgi:alanyl-tRNA synthetase
VGLALKSAPLEFAAKLAYSANFAFCFKNVQSSLAFFMSSKEWSTNEIRSQFYEYFKSKNHSLVDSAPMVIKGDPSLMFTNAGMNQFKDIFIGQKQAENPRVANSQKCLRVSGKHNDLEEVGVDTYHHTMFEMLGNWSFGDYFKKEAIQYAWELLTEVYGLDSSRIYATVFEGDEKDGTKADTEAKEIWEKYLPKDRVLFFGKKDNFWEMGEMGPCGPCSELHIDLRPESDRKKQNGADLVNMDHPELIEIWNLVFIQFNRKSDGSLNDLPAFHVDTGMGLERLSRALQHKRSNYDIDLFQNIIAALETESGQKYGNNESKDIAFRVIVDHLRAVAFSIAEGQLPSNTGPGYVIRRILRRAIRYAYSSLGVKQACIYALIPALAIEMGEAYPELKKEADLIGRVIKEEEESFLNTLAKGIQRFEDYILETGGITGKQAFELYDTFGFPFDLTRLMSSERSIDLDEASFNAELKKQKERSRSSAQEVKGDWIEVNVAQETEFVGYDELTAEASLIRYREVESKGKKIYHLQFNRTPFYPEGGGQVGDQGIWKIDDQDVVIFNTQKENEAIIHLSTDLPENFNSVGRLEVNENKRKDTENNHSATHLLHHALRTVLGKHVSQKGSLVHPNHLRFDFSHFEKINEKDLRKIEAMVQAEIDSAIELHEERSVAIEEAKARGAMSLFGEKYGNQVRVIEFGDSVELCGGTHVANTGLIGNFFILSESAISSGVRRIEAITGTKARKKIQDEFELSRNLRLQLKTKDPLKSVSDLQQKLKTQEKEMETLKSQLASFQGGALEKEISAGNGFSYLFKKLDVNGKELRTVGFDLMKKHKDLFAVLGTSEGDKVVLSVFISKELIAADPRWDARTILNELSTHIGGKGGGQAFFATAGGNNPSGLDQAIATAKSFL